jgi:hypothetical protein
MAKKDFQIPPERQRQFDLIEVASQATLNWAHANGKSLEHIYPVVPFVETDFSLDAWLFVDTEESIRQNQSNGTAGALESQLRAELAKVGYPDAWLRLVVCHFGSKEVVDRDYEGSYYYFLR